MDGTFVAAPNTFDNLGLSDWIAYIPLNVAYGTSSDYVWYQFFVDFYSGGNIGFGLCYKPSWVNQYFTPEVPIEGGYIPGDTYNVAFTTSGDDIVTFTITNINTEASWSTSEWGGYTPPNLNLIYRGDAFSPASAIEGVTSPTTLTNTPYFQTYIGTGESTYYQGSDYYPQGISTDIWQGDTGYYYWIMDGYSPACISIITSFGTYAQGGISNPPTNIVGPQDGNYAYIYGGNSGDGGYIIGKMSSVTSGQICIYGYSSPGYYSDLHVYVSLDDQNWDQVGYLTISSSTPYWIYVGSYSYDFKYIGIAGYDSGDSVFLHLDSVTAGTP